MGSHAPPGFFLVDINTGDVAGQRRSGLGSARSFRGREPMWRTLGINVLQGPERQAKMVSLAVITKREADELNTWPLDTGPRATIPSD